jgi:hypothetical protein
MTPDDPQAPPHAATESPAESPAESPTETTAPSAQDTGFRARHLPGTPAGEARGMLPGMAFIGMYLLLLAMLNAFATLHGIFGNGIARYCIFGICSLMVIGVFGFLRLRRWGWAVVTAGFLLLASGDFYFYSRKHAGFFLIRGLFSIVFFLYLSRTEVRERLR